MATERENGWREYQRLVMAELERHGRALNDLNGQISSLKTEIAMLNVKSGIWGAAAAIAAVALLLAARMLRGI